MIAVKEKKKILQRIKNYNLLSFTTSASFTFIHYQCNFISIINEFEHTHVIIIYDVYTRRQSVNKSVR